MKVYDKYLNEEKDRLVEVHTEWLKEVDNYIKCLENKIEQSDLKLLEGREIFIERFERLENQFKNLAELVVELETDKKEPNDKLRLLRGDI
ncbi:hypothetical protein [Streptococcus parauberis]|uniref:hypothetical protein n=1 Tax=Streptococcus parauberis TaxID=1348 RepID=UPI0007A7F0BD|nr:hypothetical protein [Streptococcus parauberis]KYP17750.1 hypothetical protein TN39_01962 [Streptococcus parauberis]KYP18595.1 hypothetical protein AKL14_00880 [Streptococcus parauberis]KYP19999.1 hypothetical protein AKL13_00798 [Streptococcus parauberis]KYP27329.1 hypothetical protein TM50_00634 [Streptococcus parauberis]KYP27595.1 hypothetical protein TP84_00463 [Streptococcus parauberis]